MNNPINSSEAELGNPWLAYLMDELQELMSTPKHLSKIRAWIGFSNGYRILLTFGRLTNQSLFQSIQAWLPFLERISHLPLNLEDLNRRINIMTPVFRELSVDLFAIRFSIDLILFIKNVLPEFDDTQKSRSERFWSELKKRYPRMANDIVWANVNYVCKNADALRCNQLMLTFLTFDIALLAFRLFITQMDYEAIKSKIQSSHSDMMQDEYDQLALQLHTDWHTLIANLVAANLLLAGFSASLYFSLPASIACAYFVVVIGTALYISADKYGHYQRCKFVQQSSQYPEDHSDTEEAWNQFTRSMIKNTVMSVLIMNVLAVSWPAALLLVVLSIADEYQQKYAAQNKASSEPPRTISADSDCELSSELAKVMSTKKTAPRSFFAASSRTSSEEELSAQLRL